MNTTTVKAKRETGNGAPWMPDYEYECSKGHKIGASKPVADCPVFRKGHKCEGTLTRVGKGSGKRGSHG